MIRQVILLASFFTLAIASAACTSTTDPTQAAAIPGVSPTRTLVPVPPQPTSATLAPRTSVPFLSPTPVPRVQLPASGSSPVPGVPTNPQATAVAAAPAQPASSGAGPVPTAAGVATGKRSEVKFVFLTPLKPAEEAEPPELVQMRAELKKVPGFLEVSGDEEGMEATVGYDAGLITVEQLMAKFAELKHPVKRQ